MSPTADLERVFILPLTAPKPLRDLALESMRRAITSGYWKPGERLVERTMCDQLGVSRTVVREALRHLEAEELVDFKDSRGPIVASLDRATVKQVLGVLHILCCAAVTDCASVADDHVKRRVGLALRELVRAHATKDAQQCTEATLCFFATFFHPSGHDESFKIVKRLFNRLAGMLSRDYAFNDGDLDIPKRIYASIVLNDPHGAATAAGKISSAMCEAVARRLYG